MAFTETQKSRIRTYLGFPDRWLSYESGSNIEFALSLAGGDSVIQEEIESILADLLIIDNALMSGISVAGIKAAGQGDIEFYPSGKIIDLKKTGNWLIGQLAIKLGTEPARAYYGSEINLPIGFAVGFI